MRSRPVERPGGISAFVGAAPPGRSPAVFPDEAVEFGGRVGGEAVDALDADGAEQFAVHDVLEGAVTSAGGVREPSQQIGRDGRAEVERGPGGPSTTSVTQPAFSARQSSSFG